MFLKYRSVLLYKCIYLLILTGTIKGHKLTNCSKAHQKVPLNLIGLFPCSTPSSDCDMLSYGAVSSLTTRDLPAYFPGIFDCFDIRLHSFTLSLKENFAAFPGSNLTNPFGHFDVPVHGVIGPIDSTSSKLTAHIYSQYHILQISYGVQEDSTLANSNKYPYFYSTAPTDHFLNKARLQLLKDFQWTRVALLTSNEPEYSIKAEHFVKFNETELNITYMPQLNVFGEIDFNEQLQTLKSDQFKIIIVYISEKYARNLFCQAYRLKLTTSENVWILPRMFNPNWWYLNNTDGQHRSNNCTNSEILEAINTTLFIGSQNLRHQHLENIEELVINKTLQYFTSITREELQSYWIHSNAVNAIDAASLLLWSWATAVKNFLSNGYSEESVVSMLTSIPRYDAEPSELVRQVKIDIENTLSTNTSDEEYGQAVVTQVVNGVECVIGAYHNIGFDVNNRKFLLDNISFMSSYNLGMPDPCNYTWQSTYQPIDGACHDIETCVCNLYFHPGILSTFAVIILFLVIASCLLIVMNCALSKTKHFKASAPRLTTLMTIGVIISYFGGLFWGLLITMLNEDFSAQDRQAVLPFACNITGWIWCLSFNIILGTQLMRNFRLHRIFHNPRLKERKNMDDKILIAVIAVIMLPTLILLILETIIQPIQYLEYLTPGNCTNISLVETYIVGGTCDINEVGNVFIAIHSFYLGIIFILLLIVTLTNTNVIKHFVKEQEWSAFVVPFLLLLLVLSNASQPELSAEKADAYYISIQTLSIFLLTVLLLSMYLPKIILMGKDYYKEKIESTSSQSSRNTGATYLF